MILHNAFEEQERTNVLDDDIMLKHKSLQYL